MPEALVKSSFSSYRWREQVRREDVQSIRALVSRTGVFSEEEIAVAGELAEDCLAVPDAYRFLFAENEDGVLAGYSCFGRIALTQECVDLYWIAVNPTLQQRGLGRSILQETIRRAAAQGGRFLFAETSSLPAYEATRQFYFATGFEQMAVIPDFYKPGDAKVIFRKHMASA